MSNVIEKKKLKKMKITKKNSNIKSLQIEDDSNASSIVNDTICDANEINLIYSKKCGNNKKQLQFEEENRLELAKHFKDDSYLYPNLDDPNFIIKIAEKKEFSDTRYDGTIYNVKDYADILAKAEYELLPQQAFVKNFLSFQTPYNSLLLFHGLGSGKTCSAIGVCEEMRDYMKQMGINKKILIVASPNVQDNFRLQLFDERKLKLVDGIWSIKGCLGNKLLKEINPTGMTGLSKEKVISLVKNLINTSYSFQGYTQFSNDIYKKAGRKTESLEIRIKNLQYEYSDSLIVIDEVHNIRISDDNENKNIAKNLMFLASAVSNLRLLLLSATPMFNSYKEIVWLLNLMNMNDRRGIVSVSEIFDKNGEFKKDSEGKESGKEMLIRKATGYVSYIRGENPYTFPFRVYPDRFSPNNTFKSLEEYPKYQINGRSIPDNKKINKLSLFLTMIGSYQGLGYKYIISRLLNRESTFKLTKEGKERKVSAFKNQKSFGYTDLQIPIEALNIIYPFEGLEELVKDLPEFEYIDEIEEPLEDISPSSNVKEVIEEIDDVISSGPTLTPTIEGITKKSELESEPVVTEGLEADDKMFDNDTEIDLSTVHKLSKSESSKKQTEPSIIVDADEELKSLTNSTISNANSFRQTIVTDNDNSGIHIIEGLTQSHLPSKKGGEKLLIDSKELTGAQGLKRIMDYVDSKTPAIKGLFEYRRGSEKIFQPNNIGKYSAKIKNICESIYNSKTDKVSDGIILIYSSYIDAGIIPMALALEEMGFTRYSEKSKTLFKTPPVNPVDVRTMKPPTNKKDYKPAKYIMITGDNRLSPNNDADVKAITSDDNITGEKIKVVLISQAGSEGLDFKAIRQIHVLEPWYNMNRLEQIIGRGVRNFSHKDLPFEERNVEIFLYGTILENAQQEAADLYIYRNAELKAVKIGKVTRLLKQTAVDCIINHDQTQLTIDNFDELEDNHGLKQILSNHVKLDNFQIGDMDNSSTCDYMKCEFDCLPNIELHDSVVNVNTYNEKFMLINSDKIIQKIKNLFKMRYFYKKKELLQLINIPKPYPMSQIYASLTQIITDNTEYLYDKYDRTGYLVNIGEYYLFQPSELTYKNISIFDRSVPINYKHDKINFKIKTDIAKAVIDKRHLVNKEQVNDEENIVKIYQGKIVLDKMYANYVSAFETTKVQRGINDWYQLCGLTIRKLIQEDIIPGNNEKEKLEILEKFIVEHIVDSLMMQEKIDLLDYFYDETNNDLNNIKDERLKRFIIKVQKYLYSKFIVAKGLTGIVIFDGPSRVDNLNIYVLQDSKWIIAAPEDKRDLGKAILNKYKNINNMNKYVGFIGFENNKKHMVYKVKDTENERSTGFRCDQSGKDKVMNILNEIENDNKYIAKVTKDSALELCVRQEFTLRSYQVIKLDNKTWFLDTETAIINEFEKKEKVKK